MRDLVLGFRHNVAEMFHMAVETAADFAPRNGEFGPTDRRERNFFLVLLAGIWVGILGGFGTDLADHLRGNDPPYPLLVHIHAAVFVGWLVLLTGQLLLVRNGRTDLHRRLGLATAWLVPVMLLAGLGASWASHLARYTPEAPHTAFLSVELSGLLTFGVLAGAGLRLHRTPAAHKRLMLLSTICLSTAGFARLWDATIGDLLGEGFWPLFAELNSGADLLILALGIHDLVRHGRLHPAYIAGAAWAVALEFGELGLFFSPAWRAFAPHLIGR